MARLLSPGETITQEEWINFQNETGGPMRSTRIRPPTKAEVDSGTDYEQHPIYRYYLSDGESYVEMQQDEKGDYTVVEYKPSKALQQRVEEPGPSRTETVSAPPTQKYILERKPGETEFTPKLNPNYVEPESGKKKPSGQPYKNAAGKYVQRFDDGSTEELPPEAQPFEKPDAAAKKNPGTPYKNAQGQWVRPVEDAQGNVTTEPLKPEEVPHEKPEKPDEEDTWRDPKTGTLYAIERDASGKVTGQREIKGTGESGSGRMASLPPNTHLGTIYTGIQAAAQKIAADESMTPQEKLKAYDQLQKAGELLADETSTILTSQQNTLTNQTSQRNTDVQDAASRRTFAAGLVNDSFKDVSSLAEYAPAGSGIAGPAFLGRIMLGMTLADKMGGLKTFPTVQPGAAAQQVYGQGLPGMEQQAQPQAMPQQQPQGGGQPINIFNVSQPPQSVTQAMPPNPALQGGLPQIPGGGFLPQGSPIQYSGGQLRAPGYQAPEEEEAQVPGFMGAFA